MVILGPEPTASGPDLVWFDGADFMLVVMQTKKQQPEQSGCLLATYAGMTVDEPLNGVERLASALCMF